MYEINKKKSNSGREIEYRKVRWRRITKEEEKENFDEYQKKKKIIQQTLKTPERNLQEAVFVESRSPTPENKETPPTVDIHKNYFSSNFKGKWENRQKNLNKSLINKQQIMNGIEGKIRKLTPSKSFNTSLLEPKKFENQNLKFNSIQTLQKKGLTGSNVNLLQLNRGTHDAYGNFHSQQRAPVSPYKKIGRQSSKSPQNQAQKFYNRTSYKNPYNGYDKENISYEANLKILKKPTLQNHLTIKDKERNGIRHHEPSFVEDSNIFTREKKTEEINTKITKQGILMTGNKKMSVNQYERTNEIYNDFKQGGGAIIPVNSLNNQEEEEDFIDFDELNTPNIQKHFSLHHQISRGEQEYLDENRSHRRTTMGYQHEKELSFFKNSRHGGSHHYTFKGRESSKKGGIESGYNNEWINEEPGNLQIYSQNDTYGGGY